MEVTRTNFRELLPEIINVINNASFFCIDGEFTGLNTGEDVTAFDTHSQYYNKLKNGAMNFLFFQFGLAAFRYDKDKEKYTHTAYNFYVFPRPLNRHATDIRFMCQSSCLDFLASVNFDFNKVFKDGIPYLNDPNEQEARDQLEEKRKFFKSPKEPIRVPDELKNNIEDACQQIQQFLVSNKDEQEIVLERSTSFIRKLIYQEIRERFSSDEVAVQTKNFSMVAKRINGPEHRLREEEKRRDQEDAEIEDAVGFTHIIRLLSKSGKLLIGHNLLTDLLHIVKQFYVPLPDTYEEFKELLHNLFPKILDTKYMSSVAPFNELLKSTALFHLINTLKEPPFSIPDVDCEEGKGYKSIDLKYHEAGFDAYMTGLTFLSLGAFLKKARVFQDRSNSSIFESPLLNPYLNRLHLMRVADTHICLGGIDPIPSRDHVFLLTFPKEWKYADISQLFSPFGSIFIAWLNDSTAYVALQHKDQWINVKNSLFNNLPENVTIRTYYEVQEPDNAIPGVSPVQAQQYNQYNFVPGQQPNLMAQQPNPMAQQPNPMAQQHNPMAGQNPVAGQQPNNNAAGPGQNAYGGYQRYPNQRFNNGNQRPNHYPSPYGNRGFNSPDNNPRKRFSDGQQAQPQQQNPNQKFKREVIGSGNDGTSKINEVTILGKMEGKSGSPRSEGGLQRCSQICINELDNYDIPNKKHKMQFEENNQWD